MLKLIVSRFLQGLLTLFVLVTLTFFLVRSMPGSPYTEAKAMPEHILAAKKASMGLDKPWPVQYTLYLSNLVFKQDAGDLIRKPGVKVSEVIADSFPVSLALGLASMGIALLVGIPAGVIAAVKKNTPTDFACLGFAMLGICLPSFVIGPLLAVFAGLKLQALNVAGWSSPTDWILPAVTLGLINAAYLARLSRGGMLDVLNQDYIRTAKAKGVPGARIIIRHALKGNPLFPALRTGPTALSVASRQKQIPSSRSTLQLFNSSTLQLFNSSTLQLFIPCVAS